MIFNTNLHQKNSFCNCKHNPKVLLQWFHHLQNVDLTEVGKKYAIDKKAEEVHAQHQGNVHGIEVDVLNWSLEMPNFQLDVSKIFGIGPKVGHQDENDVRHRHKAFSLTDDKALDSICKLQNNKVVK